jgi:hypothetical protein
MLVIPLALPVYSPVEATTVLSVNRYSQPPVLRQTVGTQLDLILHARFATTPIDVSITGRMLMFISGDQRSATKQPKPLCVRPRIETAKTAEDDTHIG